MIFTAPRKTLLAAAQNAQRAVKHNSPKDALKCLRIEAYTDIIAFRGTDMTFDVTSTCTGTVEAEGVALAAADKLVSILAGGTSDDVTFTLGKTLTVRGGKSKFELLTQDVSNFLNPLEQPDATHVALPASDVKRMIAQTAFACAQQPLSPLAGVNFSQNGKRLDAYAMDGRRMAISSGLADIIEDFKTARLSADSLKKLASMLTDEDERVTISFTENQAWFSSLRTTAVLTGYATAQNSPRHMLDLPQSRTFTAPKSKLIESLRETSEFITDDAKAVRMEFAENRLVLKSSDPSAGHAEVEMECELQGDPITLGMNPRILLEGLRQATGETVRLQMDKPNSGVFIVEDEYAYGASPINL